MIIADATGRVLEQWTGFQVAWTMARGYPGAFGRHVNALYMWLPLCLLFLFPFVDWRRPLSLLHLDLLVLLSFSVSLAFFNHAHIYASVPLAYPPLIYLLARMLALLRRRGARRGAARRRRRRPLRLLIPAPWLAVGVVFLLGFRIALNVTDSNVIDVGYAGVIGAAADRRTASRSTATGRPTTNTATPTARSTTRRTCRSSRSSAGAAPGTTCPPRTPPRSSSTCSPSRCCSCSAGACAGPTLGIALAYAWVVLSLHAVRAGEQHQRHARRGARARGAAASRRSPPARGVFAALAGLTKFAPAGARAAARDPRPARAPARSAAPRARRARSRCSCCAFVVTAALVSIPALAHDSLHTIYERTLAYQANRGSPFSVWGLYGWLGACRLAVQVAAVALALALAVVPRRADIVGLAAACAAVIIAVQLGVEHWFYLYIPWFFPLVMLGPAGRASAIRRPRPRRRARHQHLLDRVGPQRRAEQRISTPISHGSSSEVSKRTGICVSSDSIACSRLTPITPPRGPVMPTSVM